MADDTNQKRPPVAAPERLRAAARHIEAALVLLDMRKQDCGECGTPHWANLDHARVYQQFTDTPQKLRDAARRIETAGNAPKAEAAVNAAPAPLSAKG